MNLMFLRADNTIENIAKNVKEEEVSSLIKAFISKKNPNFKSYYVRKWCSNGIWYCDVGSHSEFFLLTDKEMGDGEKWK